MRTFRLPAKKCLLKQLRFDEVKQIEVYTDGSCNPSRRIGAWAAIILYGQSKEILTGCIHDTTNQRMELSAVLHALLYIHKNNLALLPIVIYTDSQYIIDLPSRKEKLKANKYVTAKNNVLPNADMLEAFYNLIEKSDINFIKVKGHQKQSDHKNYNREADILCRKIVRENTHNA